jgi:hypothetical protein
LGNYVSAKTKLAELDAFLTLGLTTGTLLKMFRHDPLTIWAIVVVVMDLPMPRRFFDGVGMVRSYLRHLILPSGGKMDAAILRRSEHFGNRPKLSQNGSTSTATGAR